MRYAYLYLPNSPIDEVHRVTAEALEIAPRAAVEKNGAFVDIRGMAHHEPLIGLGRLASAHGGRVGASDLPILAKAAARLGHQEVNRVPTGREREALGRMPVQELGLGKENLRLLDALGITHVKDLLALPPDDGSRRLPPAVLRAMDRARDPEGGVAFGEILGDMPERSTVFLEGAPERREEIYPGLAEMTEAVLREVALEGQVAGGVQVEILCQAGPITIETALETATARAGAHLTALRDALEAATLPGPPTEVRVRPHSVVAPDIQQGRLFVDYTVEEETRRRALERALSRFGMSEVKEGWSLDPDPDVAAREAGSRKEGRSPWPIHVDLPLPGSLEGTLGVLLGALLDPRDPRGPAREIGSPLRVHRDGEDVTLWRLHLTSGEWVTVEMANGVPRIRVIWR